MNGMRSFTGASLAVLGLSVLPHATQQDPPAIRGFSAAASRVERDWDIGVYGTSAAIVLGPVLWWLCK